MTPDNINNLIAAVTVVALAVVFGYFMFRD